MNGYKLTDHYDNGRGRKVRENNKRQYPYVNPFNTNQPNLNPFNQYPFVARPGSTPIAGPDQGTGATYRLPTGQGFGQNENTVIMCKLEAGFAKIFVTVGQI